MAVEEKSKQNLNKTLYKLELILLRTIPYILFIGHALSVLLSYLDMSRTILSMLCGVSLVPWVFILLSSYVFKFCKYHRLMIWYCGVTEIIAWLDYYITFPITDSLFFVLLFIIFGIFLFFITKCKIQNK
jgi:hypothetical protein